MVCYCMGAIRLNGNVWIILPLPPVSVSYESVIVHTAGLGEYLYGAKLFPCTHMFI
jgi:hypothetical protein